MKRIAETSAFIRIDTVGKLIRNLALIFGVLWTLWASTIGPGVRHQLREYLGINSLSERLTFIEENLEPPKVVIWEGYSQIGVCTSHHCRVRVRVASTEYGRSCGTPTWTAQTRVGSERIGVNLPSFNPVEPTPLGVTTVVPVAMPDFIGPGVHEIRFKNIYPTCTWSREPIPRYSPWFKLKVESPLH